MKCSTSVDHLVRLNDLNWEVGDEQGAIKLLLETSSVAKEQKRLHCINIYFPMSSSRFFK